MSGSSQDWTAGDLRKALIKRASENAGIGAPPETLSAPTKKTAITLADYIMYYNPNQYDLPDEVKDSQMYRILMTRLETLTSFDSVRTGDISSMRAIAGSQYEENSLPATGNEYIKEVFQREGAHIHIFGPKNSGKTNKAHYIAHDLCGEFFDEIRSNLSSNDDSNDDVVYPNGEVESEYDHMSQFLYSLHKEEGDICQIMDEVSTAMNGYAFSASDVEYQMSQAVNATRKYTTDGAVYLITVSHRKSLGDVHPVVVENADMMIETYEGEYQRATLYDGVDDKQKWDPEEKKVCDLYGIPETTVEHSDSIMAKWYWDADDYDYREGLDSLDNIYDPESDDGKEVDTDLPEVDTQKAVAVAEYLSSDDGLRTVAERHDTTHETLRNWVEEFEETGE